MRKSEYLALLLALPLIGLCGQANAESFGLESLDLQHVEQEWGQPHANQSVEGHPLTLHGKSFEHGLGTHANSSFRIALGGKAERFTATVGVDDETGQKGSVVFKVVGDGKVLWESDVLRGGGEPKEVAVELSGVQKLLLQVADAGDGIDHDHADWADATIAMSDGKPEAVGPPPEPAVVLTPKPSPKPRINGPKVVGVRPGSPFLFTVPVTGERPLSISAQHLPAGLSLDAESGIITGSLAERGTWTVELARPQCARDGRSGTQDHLRRHHRADAAHGLE